MENRTVLVVEDNKLNMKLVKCLLKLDNYEVMEAFDAETGIEIARHKKPDLILMDIQLPDMDGLSATRLLKENTETSHIPIVALTSYAMKADKDKSIKAGCAGYMTKPIDTKAFANKISSYFPVEKRERNKITGSNQYRILIVDDDNRNVKLLDAFLGAENYAIQKAYSGEEALESVADCAPDLILLDVMMPGMNGYEVARTLKGAPDTRNIPIILITSLDSMEDKIMGIDAGADEFLNKPVNQQELLARVKSLLRGKIYQEQLVNRTRTEDEVVHRDNTKTLPAPEAEVPHVLFVDDSDNDLKILKSYLDSQPYRLTAVKSGEEALDRCNEEKVDVVLLDLLLPGVDGFNVCKRLKKYEKTTNIQILMVSSLDELRYKLRGIELGADDFLIKPVNRAELVTRIRALTRKKAYMDRLAKRFDDAVHKAITDPVTGLYNHTYFKHFAGLEIDRCARQKQSLAMISFIIDNLGQYHQSHGETASSDLLKAFGTAIKQVVRKIDLPARTGDEKISLVLPYSGRSQAAVVKERLLTVFYERSIAVEANTEKDTSDGVSVSSGIACYPDDGRTVAELVMMADNSLFGSGVDQVNA